MVTFIVAEQSIDGYGSASQLVLYKERLDSPVREGWEMDASVMDHSTCQPTDLHVSFQHMNVSRPPCQLPAHECPTKGANLMSCFTDQSKSLRVSFQHVNAQRRMRS